MTPRRTRWGGARSGRHHRVRRGRPAAAGDAPDDQPDEHRHQDEGEERHQEAGHGGDHPGHGDDHVPARPQPAAEAGAVDLFLLDADDGIALVDEGGGDGRAVGPVLELLELPGERLDLGLPLGQGLLDRDDLVDALGGGVELPQTVGAGPGVLEPALQIDDLVGDVLGLDLAVEHRAQPGQGVEGGPEPLDRDPHGDGHDVLALALGLRRQRAAGVLDQGDGLGRGGRRIVHPHPHVGGVDDPLGRLLGWGLGPEVLAGSAPPPPRRPRRRRPPRRRSRPRIGPLRSRPRPRSVSSLVPEHAPAPARSASPTASAVTAVRRRTSPS